MKSIIKFTLMFGTVAIITSCSNTSSPNYQYMPNMYESVGYETYVESAAFNSPNGLQGKSGQLPPGGTVKRGFVPYGLPNTTEGYDASKLISTSPLAPLNEKDMETAKGLYQIYCSICHGDTGNGQGYLAKQGKLLGVPNYKDRVITEGSIFHVQTYGLNSMGSYANQLSQKERWMISQYVMKLKNQ